MSATAVSIEVATADGMRALGERLAALLRPGDLVVLSGPLGAVSSSSSPRATLRIPVSRARLSR